jgi:acetyl esterase/lipase
MSAYKYDPEFYEAMKLVLDGPPQPIPKDIFDIRDFSNKFMSEINKSDSPPNPEVQRTPFTVPSYDGYDVPVTLFEAKVNAGSGAASAAEQQHNNGAGRPALVWIHGGGMTAGSVAIYAPVIETYALRTGLPIFAVDYRLSPEHPAPAAVEDCYAVVAHVSARGRHLYRVDPARIALYGDSAGGLFSASVCLAARARRLDPPIAKQILIYPALDDRTALRAADFNAAPMGSLLTWRGHEHRLVWDAYLGGAEKVGLPDGDDAPPAHVVPARAASLAGLPSAYIDIGTLDMFLDEVLVYARRLAADGVQVELHVMPGLPHGWEVASGISWFQRATQDRLSAIERIGK